MLIFNRTDPLMKAFPFLSLLLLTYAVLASCQDENPQGEANPTFRTVGYLFSPQDWANGIQTIDLDKVTDINLAFINPDAEGNYHSDDKLNTTLALAKEKNVRVFFSIGGGSPPPHLHQLLLPENQTQLIEKTVEFMNTMGFDGVDVDLENELINEHYAAFISELAKRVKENKKLITAALASWNAHKITDETLTHFDLIHIMSYDRTGPWNLSKPGQHSPYEMVESDFSYFNLERNVPKHKLIAGLPFYGYGFGDGAPQSLSFKRIAETFPDAIDMDEISFPEGGTLYYNGRQTISRKVKFALDAGAGGVMIWQLLGDAPGKASLLSVIQEEISGNN